MGMFVDVLKTGMIMRIVVSRGDLDRRNFLLRIGRSLSLAAAIIVSPVTCIEIIIVAVGIRGKSDFDPPQRNSINPRRFRIERRKKKLPVKT